MAEPTATQNRPQVYDICPTCADGMLFATTQRTSDATCDLCDHVVPIGTPTPSEQPSLETPTETETQARLEPQGPSNDESSTEDVEKGI